MSFGFSIGDIVLLSKLAYDLYTSVSTGRKGASRDLKELEDVLFSLRCALDHLGEVSRDILARSDTQNGGSELKDNLNRMIGACGSTLQELDSVTKKYRDLAAEEEELNGKDKDPKKKRTFDDVARKMKVNWRKVRWDQEKQSLQQYRGKLRTHTDAINIILSSIIWSNANTADSNSKANHEKTHSLLNRALAAPQTDTSLHQMMQEIHAVLTQPKNPSRSKRTTAESVSCASSNGVAGASRPTGSRSVAFAMASVAMPAVAPSDRFTGIQQMNHTNSVPFDSVVNGVIDASVPGNQLKSPIRYNANYVRTNSVTAYVSAPESSPTTLAYRHQSKSQLPSSTVSLNTERRAFAAKEFNAYKQRHSKPAKPPFLHLATPNLPQLQAGLQYIFRSLPEGRTNEAQRALEERAGEIERWTQGFSEAFFSQTMRGHHNEAQVELLVALNGSVEQSTSKIRDLFYKASDQAGLMAVLETLQERSKSVRVMKEIEEFQDSREDWEEDRS